MKKQILYLLLLLSGAVSAQIVTIPDPEFKAFLVGTPPNAKDSEGNTIIIDSNNDDEIQFSEALTVWFLEVSLDDSGNNYPISLDGIEAFTNLRVLIVDESQEAEDFHYPALVNLEELTFFNSTLMTSVDCTGLVSLKILDIDSAEGLNELIIAGLPALEEVYVGESNLVSLDFTGNVGLQKIRVAENDLESVTVEGLTALKELNMYLNTVTDLDLSGCNSLEKIKISGTSDITGLDLSPMPYLTQFEIMDCDVSSLDLSGSPLLEIFMMGKADYLNLKNGKITYTIFSAQLNPGNYICIDEGEEEYLTQDITNGAQVNSYCSFTPGGDYNTIAGTLSFDIDNNGCGGSDPFNHFTKMTIADGTDSGTTYTNTTGNYSFYTQAGTFTITPEFENNWFTATPAFATVNSATVDNSTATKNFCIAPNGVHPDVEVVLVPIQPAQPGFDAVYQIIYKNKGNQSLTGELVFTYDDSVLDVVSVNPAETMSGTNSITWVYGDLLPFEARSIMVTLNVNGPMDTPAVNIGNMLEFNVTTTPTIGDDVLSDNTFDLNQEVVGSFDPNDKICLEGEISTPEMIGEYLHYNINFENTGTAPATFIVVKDVINEFMFDISTLQILNASHAMTTKVTGNVVEFRFDAINLGPDEKGNVVFKIKTLDELEMGEVANKAEIFFDYNFPIDTNYAITTFYVLDRGDFTKDNSVKIYPNPSNGIVNISAEANILSIQLFDVQGRILQTSLANDSKSTIDISGRAAGIYFIKILTETGMKTEKLIKE